MREMSQMSLQGAAYLGFAFPVKKALVAALPPPPSPLPGGTSEEHSNRITSDFWRKPAFTFTN